MHSTGGGCWQFQTDGRCKQAVGTSGWDSGAGPDADGPAACKAVDEIVVASREEDLHDISDLCRTYGITKCSKVVRGGASRVHSVLLAALEAPTESELLAVQDGARPLVTPELIDQVVSAAARCGAAARRF